MHYETISKRVREKVTFDHILPTGEEPVIQESEESPYVFEEESEENNSEEDRRKEDIEVEKKAGKLFVYTSMCCCKRVHYSHSILGL